MQIKINRDSIRRNPDAGKNTVEVAGRPIFTRTLHWMLFDQQSVYLGHFVLTEQCTVGADWQPVALQQVAAPYVIEIKYERTQPITKMYCFPAATWLFEYCSTCICCVQCGRLFPHTELESDAMGCYDEDSDEIWTAQKCPYCGAWDAVGERVEFEMLTSEVLQEVGLSAVSA